MKKVKLTNQQLEYHLQEQLEFIKSSCDAYDRGFDGEAKRLAVTLRVLCHESKNSNSLLGQLERLNDYFITTCLPYHPANLGAHGGLIILAVDGKETRFIAPLDDVVYKDWVSFNEWWNQPVFVDANKEKFSRKDLIRTAADQDGGAHVDSNLNEKYVRLSEGLFLGWYSIKDGKGSYIQKAERAAIRQIAHEVLKTLLPNYNKEVEVKADYLISSPSLVVGKNPPTPQPPKKFGRNKPCPCGSKKKYKHCHGK